MADVFQADSLEASLTVGHLERSSAWYCDALGFVVDRRHEREGRLTAVSLRAGAVRILLTQDDVASRIRAHGGALDTEPTRMPWGVTILRVRDPDGFRLTISSTHAA